MKSLAIRCFLLLGFILPTSIATLSQTNPDWRISPQEINIQLGESRRLQLLDENAQELRGGEWSVDNPELAEISDNDGQVVLHPKKIGTVNVTAVWNGAMRHQDITILSPVRKLPNGTVHWGTEPIGLEIRDLPAVPTTDGPHIFSLEQNDTGTYLRAFAEDGIQTWNWRLPEETKNVELVCGDWLGGALISANGKGSFTLYAVGKDGTTRWHRTIPGIRKGHAISQEHLVHILAQPLDNLTASLYGFDESTGAQRFKLAMPVSSEKMLNLQGSGSSYRCAATSSTRAIPIAVSRLFVNLDGNAYLAFTNQSRSLSVPKCAPGSTLAPGTASWKRSDKIVLWQVRPDGQVRSSVVEDSRAAVSSLDNVKAPTPTGELITDGQDGVLLSVRWSTRTLGDSDGDEEFIYRISQASEVLYKFPLPGLGKQSHDPMVLGEEGTAFATRGGKLIVFDVQLGRELWVWDSNSPEIEIYFASRGGGCVVQTADGLVLVENGQVKRKIVEGTAFVDWQGHTFKTHQKPFGGDTKKE